MRCSTKVLEQKMQSQADNLEITDELDVEEFIHLAHIKHMHYYDYSKVYDLKGQITVICPIDGEFQIEFVSHLNGVACPKCITRTTYERVTLKLRSTTLSFVRKAIWVHGDQYDYKSTRYRCNRKRVMIFCKNHDTAFYQTPNSHLSGVGCPKCGKLKNIASRKLTQVEFIRRIKLALGETTYDLSKTIFRSTAEKVTLTCQKHGDFELVAGNIIYQKQGCPKCGILKRANNKRYSTQDFIEKARRIHGDRYNYDDVDYKFSDVKITIYCNIHMRTYRQTPAMHLSGQGCPECGKIRAKLVRKKSNQQFIDDARHIHGDKYDYSKVDYCNNHTKVCIICPEHNQSFFQKPNSHLSGIGCPKCGYERLSKIRRYSTQDFIEKARRIHGDRYNYDDVDYIGSKLPITINCEYHGPYQQTAGLHLQGCGCSSCTKAGGGFDDNKSATFYCISLYHPDTDEKLYKIGITNRTIEERYRLEQIEYIVEYERKFNLGKRARNYETMLKRLHSDKLYQGSSPFYRTSTAELFTEDITKL